MISQSFIGGLPHVDPERDKISKLVKERPCNSNRQNDQRLRARAAEPATTNRAFDRHVCGELWRDYRVRGSATQTHRTESGGLDHHF